MEGERLQANQVRPIAHVDSKPALTMVWDSERFARGGGTYSARVLGIDPRLVISAAATLKIKGARGTWPDENLIRISAYPVLTVDGTDYYGPPDPHCDDLPVVPLVRADGSSVLAYGFSLMPVCPAYDLVLNLQQSRFEGYSFDSLEAVLTVWAGIHPAANLGDALAILNRVRITGGDPLQRNAEGT